ncbi:uncharacterized protein LOC143207152 isoform X2 [Lasioglossum baleicum]|uniref:uncharacterized protein LOC143207152 isoform X2 n=1 Tax=Lasioglossum baleicum TaxID=434251 RepID=UPI003FCC9565
MGWTLTGLGVALAIVVVAGAALALCRRYRIGWQWGPRNVWNVCEEWRQRLSWLWAPREEKVSLVKAQCPTAQTIPGLYRQTGNTSQHLFHSDSDLRLDAQGAYRRFELVDRDLPRSTADTKIPPQPLRPAPEPRSTARPRLSPLQTSSTRLRMHESGTGPLTPPPPMQRPSVPLRPAEPSVFLFQTPSMSSYNVHEASNETAFRYEEIGPTPESFHMDARLMYELEEERRQQDNLCSPYRQFDTGMESSRVHCGMHGTMGTMNGNMEDDRNSSYGSYDMLQRNHMVTISQSVMEPVYEPGSLPKMLQSTQNLGNDLDRTNNELQSMEMKPFRSCSLQDDIDSSYLFRESQGLQKVSQCIRSLPDLPVYETMNEIDQDHGLFEDTIPDPINMMNFTSDSTPSPVPPPPAPPDPLQDVPKKNGKITGERIFNALRLFSMGNSIDKLKFYNWIHSPPQQTEQYSSPPRFPSLIEDNITSPLQSDMQDLYAENDSDVLSVDDSKRSSDLYSPELNMEAQRTAQEVFNSLQNPPPSPLRLKEHNHEIYAYETDPSFTRTSEDILNSIEQRRKSMERQNGIFNELNELEDTSMFSMFCRMRDSQEFGSVLDDMPMQHRPSQEAFMTNYTMNDYNGISPCNRRGPLADLQAPEPEPPPDESTLKRALSVESMCSDTSVLISDLEEPPIVGQVSIGVQYINRGADNRVNLYVMILEARGLITPDGEPAQNTYAKVSLLSGTIYTDQDLRTGLYKGSSSPSYHHNFFIPLPGPPTGRLLIEVYSSIDDNDTLIGVATFQLEPPPRPPSTTWLNLTGPLPRLGELFFSLTYLPTAERLTLVVVQARNLRGSSVPGSFFVKVYLLQQGKKIHKKKTSIKKAENSPIFNESITFNVPTNILANIQLRLTVAEVSGDQSISSKPYSVGHIIVGPTSTGRALQHWTLMLTNIRHPIAKWHHLRK